MIRRLGHRLPLGWSDFGLQLGIWLGFVAAYQVARGIADRGSAEAMANGQIVMDIQARLHTLVEDDLQRVVLEGPGFLLDLLNWSYWLSQFVVLSLGLLWIYLFRNDAFTYVRNWVLAANLIGLIGYVVLPTAPPRMFPEAGFVDTLGASAALNHGSGLIELASNPYAAMPSLHGADALIIGFAIATLVKSRWLKVVWTLWPTWVWLSTMATANHFWLDIAAGVGVAGLAATILAWHEGRKDEIAPAVSSLRRW